MRISDGSSDVCSSDLAARKLVALADVYQPGVIFGARMARREQFLEHHRDLHAIGRTERIKLERMPADRQILVVRGPRDGSVDIGETPAAFLVPRPDFRSEGHTSELQSLMRTSYAVFCLKKKDSKTTHLQSTPS